MKDTKFQLRMDEEDRVRLRYVAAELGLTSSSSLRVLITKAYVDLVPYRVLKARNGAA